MKFCPNCKCAVCIKENNQTQTSTKRIKSEESSKSFCSHCTCKDCSDLTTIFENLSLSTSTHTNTKETKSTNPSIPELTIPHPINQTPQRTLLQRNYDLDNTIGFLGLINSSKQFIYISSQLAG